MNRTKDTLHSAQSCSLPVKFMKTGAVIIALAAHCVLSVQASAQQNKKGWEICNKTSYIIEVATGEPQAQGVTIRGWTRLKPGHCALAYETTLTPGTHYLFGRSSLAHRGGQRFWDGDTRFCVRRGESFSLGATSDCPDADMENHKFRAVVIEDTQHWQTNLTETESMTRARAGVAGIQRLLGDAGIYSGRIDGYIGRKTRNHINSFLKEKGLKMDTDDDRLVDLLEQAAIEYGKTIGLTFCNRTKQRVWSAMARRRDDIWESRGWWLLEPDSCARVINSPLVPANLFAYAEMEVADGRVRTLKQGTDSFCVASSKFVITGHENCEAAAWRTSLFVATGVPQNNRLVFDFSEDDFGHSHDGKQIN